MPKITKIEVQKKDKSRFNLYLDGEFEMGIDMETLVKFHLQKDQVLEPADMERIQKYEYYQKALHSAIQYLSYRKRTEKELTTHLIKQEFPENIVQSVIDTCYEKQYINHEDYAESLKNTMIATTDKGPEVYRQKLYQAGIEPHLMDQFTEKYIAEQPFDDIVKVATKIYNQKKGPKIKKEEKVKQSLAQKGYAHDTIFEVIQALDFEENEEAVALLLQRDLEKVYNKNQRKYEGQMLKAKTIEALLRKGYPYDQIKHMMSESGIENV